MIIVELGGGAKIEIQLDAPEDSRTRVTIIDEKGVGVALTKQQAINVAKEILSIELTK